MPAADILLDSNVLPYSFSDTPSERRKRQRAAALIGGEQLAPRPCGHGDVGCSSGQNGSAYPAAKGGSVSWKEFFVFPFVNGTAGLYWQAARLSLQDDIHPYDAAIVAGAQELGPHTVYSQDMNRGQTYDGVKVINPL